MQQAHILAAAENMSHNELGRMEEMDQEKIRNTWQYLKEGPQEKKDAKQQHCRGQPSQLTSTTTSFLKVGTIVHLKRDQEKCQWST